MIAAGFFVLVVVLLATTMMPLLLKLESTVARQLTEIRDLHETVARQIEHLATIAENTRISDAAKSLAHRQQEVEALRTAILDEIRSERWDSALYLIDEMERRFGFKQETDRIREELDDARNAAIQDKLDEAITLLERHFQVHAWDMAQEEIDRLVHALPNEVRVIGLQERMRALKEQHKRDLKVAWADAVRRSDTDHAIDVLKELDQYLSAAEAQELQASARDVFKEKLLQLGVQFRFAVKDKRWQDALSIGLELIREFPNARMASEVREALDTLRDRARVASDAEVAQTAAGKPRS
jgi:outer membrane protein assembly factor BamD (BamD/ComL family)